MSLFYPYSTKRKQQKRIKRLANTWGTRLGRYRIRMANRPTPIEASLATILDSLDVSYTQQSIIGHIIVDFLLPEHKLVLEADGKQWHTDKARDARRDKFLAMRGYKCAHFDGRVIMKEPETVKSKLIALLDERR